MNTPFNQYNEVLDYFVIEGYQEGCISITNDEPTDADLNCLAYNGELYGFIERNPNFLLDPVKAEKSDRHQSFTKAQTTASLFASSIVCSAACRSELILGWLL
jgi:hypothetical protein